MVRVSAQKLLYADVFTVEEEEPLWRFFSGPPVEKTWYSGLLLIVEKLISFSELSGKADNGDGVLVALLAKQYNVIPIMTPKIRKVFFTAQS